MMNRVERNAANEVVASARQMLQLFELLVKQAPPEFTLFDAAQAMHGPHQEAADYATYTRLRNAVQVMESLLTEEKAR